jgi:hypothetical protein
VQGAKGGQRAIDCRTTSGAYQAGIVSTARYQISRLYGVAAGPLGGRAGHTETRDVACQVAPLWRAGGPVRRYR